MPQRARSSARSVTKPLAFFFFFFCLSPTPPPPPLPPHSARIPARSPTGPVGVCPPRGRAGGQRGAETATLGRASAAIGAHLRARRGGLCLGAGGEDARGMFLLSRASTRRGGYSAAPAAGGVSSDFIKDSSMDERPILIITRRLSFSRCTACHVQCCYACELDICLLRETRARDIADPLKSSAITSL